MHSKGKRLLGRVTQVDILPFEVGFIVSVGRVTLWVGLEEAEDLLETLGRALMVEATGGHPTDAAHEERDSDDDQRDPIGRPSIPPFRGTRRH
jgi:hypothetical protein